MDPRSTQQLRRPPRGEAPPRWGRYLRAFLAVALLSVVVALAAACAPGDARSPGKEASGTTHRTAHGPSGEPSGSTLAGRASTGERAREPSGANPAAAAYEAAASWLPGISPGSVGAVYRSTMDPSWASVRIAEPGEKYDFVVFVEEENGVWKARRSVRADEPDHPQNDTAALGMVPQDLLETIYPEELAALGLNLRAEPVEPEELPRVDPPDFAPANTALEHAPPRDARRLKKGVKGVKKAVEGYDGVAGVYVDDLKGGWGYGVRPDEEFFSASVIKVPIMVAVYRKIDQGKLSLSDTFETRPEDWAAGAGDLQWEPAGTPHTVGDYLGRMITESDNVAANALVRAVGGRGYVNRVARSLGARDTLLYQKLSSERAITPYLDNRTTPRDMTTMLEKIAKGEAASPRSCKAMVELLRRNTLESWLEDGLPKGIEVANKAGWLYKVYDEVGIVFHHQRPYAVAILSEQSPADPTRATPGLKKISAAVWQAQSLP